MDKPTLIILGILITVLVIMILLDNIKKRAYLKGYKQAEFDLTASLFDNATWFGGRPLFYNALYLFAAKYRKYGYVSASRFRDDILSVNHEKRVTDLPKEELERII
ncbi:MAG: hypothetical protein KYX68_07930 [Flavobacterium sp.]|nr:hypothetical protein [Flavobacterium sp.]